MKISFIQSLLFRNYSTSFSNDLFRNNDKVNETSPASNDDHISDDIEDTKDEDKPVVYSWILIIVRVLNNMKRISQILLGIRFILIIIKNKMKT